MKALCNFYASSRYDNRLLKRYRHHAIRGIYLDDESAVFLERRQYFGYYNIQFAIFGVLASRIVSLQLPLSLGSILVDSEEFREPNC